MPLSSGLLSASYEEPHTAILPDGTMVTAIRIPAPGDGYMRLSFSHDRGRTWSEPVKTPLLGIVPDKLLELDNGRWIISAHHAQDGALAQFLRWSDDQGKSWSEPVTVAKDPAFQLCEVSLLPLGNGVIAAFLREIAGQRPGAPSENGAEPHKTERENTSC